MKQNMSDVPMGQLWGRRVWGGGRGGGSLASGL